MGEIKSWEKMLRLVKSLVEGNEVYCNDSLVFRMTGVCSEQGLIYAKPVGFWLVWLPKLVILKVWLLAGWASVRN